MQSLVEVTEDSRRRENSSAIIVFPPPRGCTGCGSRHQQALHSHAFPPPRDPDKVATASPCGQMPKAEVTLQKAAAPSRSAASMRPPPPCSRVVKALGSVNLNRLNLVPVSAGCKILWAMVFSSSRRGRTTVERDALTLIAASERWDSRLHGLSCHACHGSASSAQHSAPHRSCERVRRRCKPACSTPTARS